MKVGDTPYLEVLEKHNPKVLFSLLLNRWLKNKLGDRKELDKFAQIASGDLRLKFAEVVCLINEHKENKTLMLLKELYEEDGFIENELGKDVGAISHALSRIHGEIICLEYVLLNVFEKHHILEDETSYVLGVFTIIMFYYKNEENHQKVIIACKKALSCAKTDRFQSLLCFFELWMKVNEEKHRVHLENFQNEFERIFDCIDTYEMGLLMISELFYQLTDIFGRIADIFGRKIYHHSLNKYKALLH